MGVTVRDTAKLGVDIYKLTMEPKEAVTEGVSDSLPLVLEVMEEDSVGVCEVEDVWERVLVRVLDGVARSDFVLLRVCVDV